MARLSRNITWGGAACICTLLLAAAPAAAAPTCDAARVDPDSYALTTRAMAQIVTEDRSAWWERFSIARAASDLRDLNWGSAGW